MASYYNGKKLALALQRGATGAKGENGIGFHQFLIVLFGFWLGA